MWYSGNNGIYWSTGYAVSIDGMNWLKYPKNPVLTWNQNQSEAKNIITPSVIKDNNLYKMWFTSSYTDHDYGDFTIGYATSMDGINWIVQNYKQLLPSQTWDAVGVTHPFVLKMDNNFYYMWYCGRQNPDKWTIGLATSSDGINWTPYPANPVIKTTTVWWERGHNLGPYVLYDDNNKLFKMWYNTTNLGSITSIAYAESSDGISWEKPADKNPILLNEIPGYFDSIGISDGSVITFGNSHLLWYGGSAIYGFWNIGLAYDGDPPVPLPIPTGSLFPEDSPTPTIKPTETLTPTPSPIPSPTSTPIPTPTPIPSPTPTPKQKEPIVLIPGMFASWNKEAMLEGNTNANLEWKMLGFVRDYDGIIQTLKNLGYKENETLFIWFYDWRKPVNDIASQLNQFIVSKVIPKSPTGTFSLVGHSLGGIVGRTWAQMDKNYLKLSHIITVASPHQGVIQPYRAWEGGDLTQDDTVMSFASAIVLHVNKKTFQTDRETIQQIFPVLKNLLPSSPSMERYRCGNSTKPNPNIPI